MVIVWWPSASCTSPQDRARGQSAALGDGSTQDVLPRQGEYDAVMISEAPEDETRFALATSAREGMDASELTRRKNTKTIASPPPMSLERPAPASLGLSPVGKRHPERLTR